MDLYSRNWRQVALSDCTNPVWNCEMGESGHEEKAGCTTCPLIVRGKARWESEDKTYSTREARKVACWRAFNGTGNSQINKTVHHSDLHFLSLKRDSSTLTKHETLQFNCSTKFPYRCPTYAYVLSTECGSKSQHKALLRHPLEKWKVQILGAGIITSKLHA
jgi:hypothetical protein